MDWKHSRSAVWAVIWAVGAGLLLVSVVGAVTWQEQGYHSRQFGWIAEWGESSFRVEPDRASRD